MRFSPHKNKSTVSCSAPGCKSIAYKEPTLRFHQFPNIGDSYVTIVNEYNDTKHVDRRWAWEKILKIKNDNSLTKKFVCSLHFKKEDYVLPDVPAQYRRLKRTAVPSLNLPNSESVTEASIKRKKNNAIHMKRVVTRSFQKQLNSLNKVLENEISNVSRVYVQNESIENEKNDNIDSDHNYLQNQENSYINIEHNYCLNINNEENDCMDIGQNCLENIEHPISLHLDKEVQTSGQYNNKAIQTDREIHLTFIKSEKDLNIMTGLPTFEHLYFLENIVKVVTPQKAFFYYYSSKLSIKDRIVMTFIKLKQNICYRVLQILFQVCTEENCRTIFLRMITTLSTGLKPLIHWPEKNEILKNVPECFNYFTNINAVIDIIEIDIESPKNLCCRLASHSNYKKTNIVRFMIAITPAGLISFVSNGFLGSSSDTSIFEESNFIKYFNKSDGLMANKTFLVDKICLKHNVQLVKPPIFDYEKQFSKVEELPNVKVVNTRIKLFKILNNEVPTYLVPIIEQIFTIICAVVNLNSPIFK